MRNLLLVAIAGIGGWYFYQKFQLSKRLKVVFKKISLSGGSLLSPKINVEFGVQNPTNASTTIKSIVGTLTVGSKDVADINSFQKVTITPNSETKISINAQLRTTSILQKLIDIITGKDKKVIVRFVGTVNAEGFSVPVNADYRL